MPQQVSSEAIDKVVSGRTITTDFLDTVGRHGDAVALRWRDGDDWKEWTFTEYADRVARAASGLAAAGVGAGDRVLLMMRNRPEFHVLDLAVLMCGGTPISIYNSSSPEQILYIATDSGAKVAIAEDAGFLDRFLEVRAKLDAVESIFVIDPPKKTPDEVGTYESLLESDPCDMRQAASVAKPDDLCTVIYTSGTTGPSKGVMLSHYNVCWTVESLKQALPFDTYAGKRLVSYLPMAHIAERMVSHYQQVALGFEVTTCPDPGLIAEYAREVHPNVVFGVPRVWEKIYSGVSAALAADPEKAQKFGEAVEAARPIALARSWGEATEEQEATYSFLDDVAFKQVRELIGLDQVDAAITGAAPITAELLGWFRAIGVPLSEVYGLSETSGPMTFTAERIKPGTVGPAIPGCEVKLADDGEIICRGGNVFLGYLNAPDKTAEVLDTDGWFHSGDIGEVDDDGYFKIVDRKKELIITAGGKNISPANLEAALKTIPLVGQACAIGDNRPFVSALLVLDPEVAPAWAQQHDIDTTDLSELAQHPDVLAEVEKGVAAANEQFSRAEQIKKFTILGEEWLPDSEELTPTSKLKRRGVHSRYAAEIEAIYS